VIDYALPEPDRDAMLAKVKAELRSEHRRLTDVQIDLIADVAIELRIVRDSFWRRANAAKAQSEDRLSP
jgi:hypothetical protein